MRMDRSRSCNLGLKYTHHTCHQRTVQIRCDVARTATIEAVLQHLDALRASQVVVDTQNQAAIMQQPREVLPKSGLVYSEKGELPEVVCKPKILPIKSATLEKILALDKAAASARVQTAMPPRPGTSR